MSRMDADLFRYFRRERKMTQLDLARILGVHPRTIKNIESGKVRPSLKLEMAFAALTAKHESSRRETHG